MQHFSCDLCSQDLTERPAERYVVKLEVAPAPAARELTEADLDTDHVEAMAEMLQELEESGEHALLPPSPKRWEYDLCPACHAKFLADPLGRGTRRKLSFSKN